MKARVIAGYRVSRPVWREGREGGRRTAYLHLVPQLRLALLTRLALLYPPSSLSARARLARHGAPLALQRNLAGMHIALRLHALTLAPVLGRVHHTRRRRTRNLTRPNTPTQPLRLLPLQLLQHLFDGNRVEDLLRRGRQDGENSERAVFLVLLEAPAQILLCNALLAHALPCLAELAQRILAGEVGGAEDAGADGEVCAVAPQPAARALYHGGWSRAVPEAS